MWWAPGLPVYLLVMKSRPPKCLESGHFHDPEAASPRERFRILDVRDEGGPGRGETRFGASDIEDFHATDHKLMSQSQETEPESSPCGASAA